MVKGAKKQLKQLKQKEGGVYYKQRTQTRRKQKGAGWTDLVDAKHMISPGNQTHQPYPPPFKDCAGTPMRAGTLGPSVVAYREAHGGLPGFAGGAAAKRRKTLRGGVAPFPGAFKGAPIELKYPQAGGRWGSFPDVGPLNPTNAVGATSYAPIGRIPCEVGTRDALNPNPDGVQTMSTAPGWVPGWTPYRTVGGGSCGCGLRRSGGSRARNARNARKQTQKQKGGVQVGEVDSMRYYAPTAGYDNLPLMPQVQNNPGILMQVGYPARHFNMACMKTN